MSPARHYDGGDEGDKGVKAEKIQNGDDKMYEYDYFYDGSIGDDDDDGNDIGDDDNSSVEISGTNEEQLGDAQTAKREDSYEHVLQQLVDHPFHPRIVSVAH